jgi:hypothetical protein
MSENDRTNLLYNIASWLFVLVVLVAWWKGLW